MKIFDITLFWIHISPSYYGLMYAIWFLAWYYIIKKRAIINSKILDDLLLYIVAWVVLWWRIWYILFYNFSGYLANPIDIIKVWEWWMSFHGWVLWVILAMILFARNYKINFYSLADQITLVLPIWLFFGRIWNYLNQELLWFSNYTWIAAVYKNGVWYFPSPLLEAFLEWIILFIILNLVYRKNKNPWQIASLFLIFYAIFRIFVEIFFREPDKQLWLFFGFLSMWEILSLPMIIFWIYFYIKLEKWKIK